MRAFGIAGDVVVLADVVAIPGLGHLTVSSFVVRGEQPFLVDTGLPRSRADLLALLWEQVDPADLCWVFLTHPDRDHTGALDAVLAAAPSARLVTTFTGAALLSIEHRVPRERLYLLNPGESLDVGGRTMTAFRPPLFDSPASTGFADSRTGAVFSSDFFGAPMPDPALALGEDAADLPAADLDAAQRLWATVDSPWVGCVDRARYAAALRALGEPALVLSAHLPPARGIAPRMLASLAAAPDHPPFVGPSSAAIAALRTGGAAGGR